MNHAFFDGLEQQQLRLRVRPSGPDSGIDVLRCQELPALLQKNKQMHMWKTPLLKLDGVNVRNGTPEDAVFLDISNDGLLLQLEGPRNQVWAVGWMLTRKELAHDPGPVRIGGNCDK
jgi:hypothetical protein